MDSKHTKGPSPEQRCAETLHAHGVFVYEYTRAVLEMKQQRDDLLAALVAAVEAHGPLGDDTRPAWFNAACAAIAKARKTDAKETA